MTIAEQLKHFQAPLEQWIAKRKGKLTLCPDILRVVTAVLSLKPGVPCAYLVCSGELPRGENSAEGKVDRTFLLVLTCGSSLKIDSAEAFIGDGGALDLCEEARETLRAVQFEPNDDEEIFPNYKGTRPFQVEGYLLDAWQIEVSIGAQLPPVSAEAAQ